MLEGEDFLRTDAASQALFRPLFDLSNGLLRFGLKLPPGGPLRYDGASPEIVISAVMALFATSIKTMRGVHHLCENTLTEPATMLLRALCENWAALGFIVSDPIRRAERAHWYLIAEGVENHYWGHKLLALNEPGLIPDTFLADPDALLKKVKADLFQREIVERGEEGAQARADAMLDHMRAGRWGGMRTEEMYAIAERWANRNDESSPVLYVTVQKFASAILHGRKPDMALTMTPGGTFYPNLGANPALLPFVMFHSCLLFIVILRAVDEVFGQQLARSIDGFYADLRLWAQTNKSVGRFARD